MSVIVYKDGNKIIDNYHHRYITYLTKLSDRILFPYNPKVYIIQLSTKFNECCGQAFLGERLLYIRPALSFNNLYWMTTIFFHEVGHYNQYFLEHSFKNNPKLDEPGADFFGFSVTQWLNDENVLEKAANMPIWSQLPLDTKSYKERPFSYKMNNVIFDRLNKSELTMYKKAMSRDIQTPWLLPLKLSNITL